MGQKSLSVLHRVDSSMLWNVYMHNKNYKWLSYNLWFSYLQFFKIIYFMDQNDFLIYNNLNYVKNSYINKNYLHIKKLSKHKKRFSYYIDLYCVEFYNYVLLLNLYFQVNLGFFKKAGNLKNKKKKLITHHFF